MSNFLTSDYEPLYIPVYKITKEVFNELSLEDVNYSMILFIFSDEYNKIVCNKINEWKLGKGHRLDFVIETGMFYVENCDIQTIDNEKQLFFELFTNDSINTIYILGESEE